jgi:hypothetical protein
MRGISLDYSSLFGRSGRANRGIMAAMTKPVTARAETAHG